MPVEYQVIIIYAATKKYLLDIPTSQVLAFEKELFQYIDTKYPEIPKSIRETKEMKPETEEQMCIRDSTDMALLIFLSYYENDEKSRKSL